MLQLELSISEIVTSVWDSVLGLKLVPDDSFELTTHRQHTYAGVIQINGEWQGAIAVQCSDALARLAARTMFGMTDDAISVDDLQDALGELTNMTGGNIKALLPGVCALGLPVVVEGADSRFRLPGSAPVLRSSFRVDDEEVVVTVLERV